MSTNPMTDPKRSKDITIAVHVNYANPNGNPDQGGQPRIRDTDEFGEMTGVSFKRMLRDHAEKFHGVTLAVPQGGIKSEIRAKSKDFESFVAEHWDQRLFGGMPFLLSMKDPKAKSLGRGAVQVDPINLSVKPVVMHEYSITCAAGESKKDIKTNQPKEGLRGNFGDIFVIQHGLYVIHATYDAKQGIDCGVTERDLTILFDGILGAWGHHHSATRTGVTLHGAWVATHPHARRSENTTVAFRRLNIQCRVGVPTSMEDYTINFDDTKAPAGMVFNPFDDTSNGYPLEKIE